MRTVWIAWHSGQRPHEKAHENDVTFHTLRVRQLVLREATSINKGGIEYMHHICKDLADGMDNIELLQVLVGQRVDGLIS